MIQGRAIWAGIYGEWPADANNVPDYATVTVAGNSVFIDLYDFYAGQAPSDPGPSAFDLGDFVGSLSPGWYNLYIAQWSNLYPLPAVGLVAARGDEYLGTFPVYHMGDANLDGRVNVGDLQLMVAAWATGPDVEGPEDANGDGYVNVSDLQALAVNWAETIW